MLLDLCITSRLRIMNGRILGDTQGKFTAHCSLESSVIGYMISSEELIDRFLYIKVNDFKRSLSPHIVLCHLSELY